MRMRWGVTEDEEGGTEDEGWRIRQVLWGGEKGAGACWGRVQEMGRPTLVLQSFIEYYAEFCVKSGVMGNERRREPYSSW